MKLIIKPIATMIAMVSMLSFGSCSNEEEAMTFSPEKSNQQGVDFVAEFTPQQEAALIETGNPYGEVAQKDSHILPSIGRCFELSFFVFLKI